MPKPVLEDRVSELCGAAPVDWSESPEMSVEVNSLPEIVPRYPADARTAFGDTLGFGTNELTPSATDS